MARGMTKNKFMSMGGEEEKKSENSRDYSHSKGRRQQYDDPSLAKIYGNEIVPGSGKQPDLLKRAMKKN
jgi:hypothetical protein